MNQNPFVLNKTIYAKAKPVSKLVMQKILMNEVEYHLAQYPDLKFIGIGKEPRHNDDLSITYQLFFEKK